MEYKVITDEQKEMLDDVFYGMQIITLFEGSTLIDPVTLETFQLNQSIHYELYDFIEENYGEFNACSIMMDDGDFIAYINNDYEVELDKEDPIMKKIHFQMINNFYRETLRELH